MSNESRGNLENNFVPDQKILKGIFDVIGTLVEKGEQHMPGHFLSKKYSPPSTAICDNLIDIVVAQVAEKGKQENLKMPDRIVILSFRGSEIERVDYKIWMEKDSCRIEKDEAFKRDDEQKFPVSRFPFVNWYLELKEMASLENLEKKLGYANVDTAEAQRLLELLNELAKSRV